MINLVKQNIFKQDVEAIVNTVNCVGVMGRGIALQFKKNYPENYKFYLKACKDKEVRIGKMLVFKTNTLHNPKYIINFPTKDHWKSKSKIQDIESGLKALIEIIKHNNIKSIAIPPLGCGLGGLDWREVLPKIQTAFMEAKDVSAIVLEPHSEPDYTKVAKNNEVPEMTIGRAALIGLMRRYLQAVMDPTISLLEIHKLMYFMQEAGENLKLRYKKAPYGPYAENLSHVLDNIEGHFISGYTKNGDEPAKPITPNQKYFDTAERLLQEHTETLGRFKKVNDLIQGFETPYGMELLATIHWVASKESHSRSVDEIISKTYEWNSRKKQFTPEQIKIAFDVLKDKSWLKSKLDFEGKPTKHTA